MHPAPSPQFPSHGEFLAAPRIAVDGCMIVCEGDWLKTAKIFDEVWLERLPSVSPAALAEHVRESDLGADIFTFAQTLPEAKPLHPYRIDWDSLAVADTTDFKKWWESLPQESRKNVRKAQKRGVRIAPVEFSDDLVLGIKGIYDETPVRQGRRFWHYGKELPQVKRENATYLERSQFIGAYLGDELIGFLKMVYSGENARIMQILAKAEHYDKHPTNALLASAVEICAKKSAARLIYGQYIYGTKRNSSVTEFKRRNGFNEVLIPRYYIPLTMRGRVAIAAEMHRGLAALVPEPLINFALEVRAQAHKRLSWRRGNSYAAASRS